MSQITQGWGSNPKKYQVLLNGAFQHGFDIFCSQLRLDFSTFIITGPSTSTLSVAKTVGGQIIAGYFFHITFDLKSEFAPFWMSTWLALLSGSNYVGFHRHMYRLGYTGIAVYCFSLVELLILKNW